MARNNRDTADVEKAVLGAMMIDNKVIDGVAEILDGVSNFYDIGHRKIYTSILSVYESGIPADQVTVSEELSRKGELDDVGGAATIASLAGEMASAVNAEYHAKVLVT